MLDIVLSILGIVGGIVLIAICSDLAVTHSATLASMLGVSSLIVGMTIVSIGTDIPEIMNSIISSSIGHGNINVGDALGSVLSQITLIFGILGVYRGFNVKRKEILIIGACLIIALVMIYSVVEKGYITRLNAIFLMGSFIFYSVITWNVTKSDHFETVDLAMDNNHPTTHRTKKYHACIALLAFCGVAVSSIVLIQSVITLSSRIGVPEYVLSFFMLSIGTSLPELAVDATALRKRKYDIAIGDILGSCIVDSTIAIAIGQVIYPQAIDASRVVPSLLYTIVAALGVIAITAARQKVDKKSGMLFIPLYGMSYSLLFIM